VALHVQLREQNRPIAPADRHFGGHADLGLAHPQDLLGGGQRRAFEIAGGDRPWKAVPAHQPLGLDAAEHRVLHLRIGEDPRPARVADLDVTQLGPVPGSSGQHHHATAAGREFTKEISLSFLVGSQVSGVPDDDHTSPRHQTAQAVIYL
jgi:hypothetical protein